MLHKKFSSVKKKIIKFFSNYFNFEKDKDLMDSIPVAD